MKAVVRLTSSLGKFQSMSSQRRPQPYRYIHEGEGGTFSFNSTNTNNWFIGIDLCETCVGVYFQVDDDRCFMAHINAYIQKDEKLEDMEYTPSAEQAIQLKRNVRERLEHDAKRYKWNPHAACVLPSLIMVCPHPNEIAASGESEHQQVGHYIVEAIKEFLGADANLRANDAYVGFVKKFPDGETHFFDHGRKVCYQKVGSDLDKFQPHIEFGVAGRWTISIMEGWSFRDPNAVGEGGPRHEGHEGTQGENSSGCYGEALRQ